MRTMVLGLLLVAGCFSSESNDEVLPGRPTLTATPGVDWVTGETNTLRAEWLSTCDGDFSCYGSSVTITAMTCNGCTLLGDPVGQSATDRVDVHAVAASDAMATFTATLRFEQTGDTATVDTSVLGDHETGIDVKCQLIDADLLARDNTAAPARDCTAPRLANDVVVVTPSFRTFRGKTRFPICVTDSLCFGDPGEQQRRASALSITPTPDRWLSSRTGDAYFAVLPAFPADGGHVSVTAKLSPSGTATTELDVPAVAPSPLSAPLDPPRS